MSRCIRLVDLFCGAGGCTKGYENAGIEVVAGVDNKFKNYIHPEKFIKIDALKFLDDMILRPEVYTDIDVVHLSPPCQAYSFAAAKHRNLGKCYPDLINDARERVLETGKYYVIENVKEAPLINSVILCGTMFGCKLIRHRKFESNIPLSVDLKCNHEGSVRNGDFITMAGHGGDGSGKLKDWQKASGITWMTKEEMAQAIPPAYTEYIGKQIIKHLCRN